MSFPIILIIMLGCGLLGGLINYLLPANDSTDTEKKKIRPGWQCILLGLGATLLVPLFLEIAQSRLLDGVYFSFNWQQPADSDVSQHTGSAGKSYLLYGAYCLLAAAAGFRFIESLINNVVKDQQISKQQSQISDLKKAKEKREQNSQISQQQEDEKVRTEIKESGLKEILERGAVSPKAAAAMQISTLPILPEVTHPDDPQKGRFGGSPRRNGRTLKAAVSESQRPNFYNVVITVESDNPTANPLNSDVIFYIHDSFSPSVYRIEPSEFKEGKAISEILSYGAFTVGAITDNGSTLLELDLSQDSSFPKKFRER
jgi:hypothetical protein